MSWVRRDSNAALQRSFAEARDFEITTAPVSELPTESTGLEIESPVTTERQRPSRRSLFASMALGLVLGVFLPIALFLPLYRTSPGNATELGSRDTGIHISVSEEIPNLTVDSKSGFAKEIRAETIPAGGEMPSNNAQFVADQPVSLQPRQYLSIRGEPRIYKPEIILEPMNGRGKSVKVAADDLKILSGASGRYRAPNSNAEWQGKWSFDNSEQNLRNGSAYSDYLDKAFDASFGNKLSAINTKPTKLLSNIERNAAGPSGQRR